MSQSIQIKTFLRALEGPDVPICEFEIELIERRLRRCISCLCGQLKGFSEAHVAVQESKNERERTGGS